MLFKISKLKKLRQQYPNIVLYGCGKVAQETYRAMKKNGIMPNYFIVTRKDDRIEDDVSIPVFEIGEKIEEIKNDEVFIIVAVSSLYTKEIQEILFSYDIYNYSLISNFYRDGTDFLEGKPNGLSLQGCLSAIAEWYIDFRGDENLDIDDEIEKLKTIVNSKERNNKKIIFAVGDLSPRVIKIAKALQQVGYEIKVFISPRAMVRDVCKNGLKQLNISYVVCECIEEFMYRIILEKGKLLHLFTYIENVTVDSILIQYKELFPPIIYDEYDIHNKMYAFTEKNMLEKEKYCLENADGICNRGFEIDYLKELGFYVKGKVIQFHDFCNDGVVEFDKEDSELSLCYVGGVATEREYPDASFSCILELAEKCEKEGCHLHIYPSIWDDERYNDYIELDRKSLFFHFHKPVPTEKLQYEISKLDYGIMPIKKDFYDREINGYYKKEKYIYCTTNKLFDYLDAGMPIITPWSIKLVQYLEPMGVVLNWAIEDYDFDELRRRKKGLREKAKKAKDKLQMKNNIRDLISFYDSL